MIDSKGNIMVPVGRIKPGPLELAADRALYDSIGVAVPHYFVL